MKKLTSFFFCPLKRLRRRGLSIGRKKIFFPITSPEKNTFFTVHFWATPSQPAGSNDICTTYLIKKSTLFGPQRHKLEKVGNSSRRTEKINKFKMSTQVDYVKTIQTIKKYSNIKGGRGRQTFANDRTVDSMPFPNPH